MKKIDVSILGCTGTVGQRLIEMLHDHPWFNIVSIAASERSAGKAYKDAAINWYLTMDIPEDLRDETVVNTDPSEAEAPLVFSALPSGIAKEVEGKFAEAGCAVTSNASAYRMETDVPLIIPEVNADHLQLIDFQRENREWEGYIVTDPNCTTIGLAMALKPIHNRFKIDTVHVSTMQAISGAGLPGVPGLMIEDNVIPYIKDEEEKVISETRKVLGKIEEKQVSFADFKMAASCNRVPVVDGHTESVFIKTREPVDVEEAKKVLSDFQGAPQKLNLPSAPKKPIIVRDEANRPQPRLDRMAGTVPGMSVTVGRIRLGFDENTLLLTLISHNTIRGAAGAVVLNAELLYAKNYL
ncbi:MAG: aspartate-semialdehyde dehydrogenase [Candidatus Lokiarchaeia archaeon]